MELRHSMKIVMGIVFSIIPAIFIGTLFSFTNLFLGLFTFSFIFLLGIDVCFNGSDTK